MILLPFEDFYVVTDLKTEEALKKLAREVKRGTWSLDNILASSGTYFNGYILGNSFKFNRNVVNYTNCLPQIEGHIAPHRDGSLVHIKMRMLITTMIISFTWVSILGFWGIAAIIDAAISDEFDIATIIPIALALIIYFITMTAFKIESIMAKNKLLEIFEGKIEYGKAVG